MSRHTQAAALDLETTESPELLAQSGGFVTHGSGISGTNDGVISIFLALVFGGFCGLMGGFIVAHLARYLTYLTGRNFGRGRWVLLGAVLGALVFGVKACTDAKP